MEEGYSSFSGEHVTEAEQITNTVVLEKEI
jgi:hypothetical protein